MADKVQTIHLPGGLGIDEYTHARQLQAPKMLQCINGRFRNDDATEKRPGNALLASVTDNGAGRLWGWGDELVAIDGKYLNTYAPSQSAFVQKELVPECYPEMRGIANSAFDLSQGDIAYNSGLGLVVYVWCTAADSSSTGNIEYTIADATTGAELVSHQLLKAGTWKNPRVCSVGSTVVAVYQDTSGNIWGHYLSAGPTWSAAIQLQNSQKSGNVFEIATDGTSLFLAYQDSAPAIKVFAYDTTLVSTANRTTTETTSNAITAMGMCATASETVWVAYAYNATGTEKVRALGCNTTLGSQTVNPFDVDSGTTSAVYDLGVCRLSSTTACVAFSGVVGLVSVATCASVIDTSAAVVGNSQPSNRLTHWCQLASKPFMVGTKTYAWTYAGNTRFLAPSSPTDSQYTWSLVLLDLLADDTTSLAMPARYVCTEAPRIAVSKSGLAGPPSSVVTTSTDIYTCISQIRKSNGTDINGHSTGRTGFVAIDTDFAHSNRWQMVDLGAAAVFTPGSYYDGARVGELNFAYYPQQLSVSTSAGGGSKLTLLATYVWRAIYTYVDSVGQVYRSAPSDPIQVALTGSNNTASVVVPCLSITSRFRYGDNFTPKIGVELYRSLSTDTSTLYRVFSEGNTPVNDPNAEYITITDDIPDSTIELNPTLYTLGGVKPNVQPPAFSSMVSFRGRIWGAKKNVLWYSKAIVDGEAPAFCDAFTQPLDTQESITAMWIMDETLYVSTANRIYFLPAVEGPTDANTANDITAPVRIATDVGCTEARSPVTFSAGTLYQSAVGLQALTRDRQVPPLAFGRRTASTQVSFPTIVGSLVHPSGAYLLVFCNGNTGGARIMYDYAQDEWGTDVLYETDGVGKQFRSCCVKGGTVYWMDTSNAVYQETPASWLDGASWVTVTLGFGEFHPAGLQGFMNVPSYTFNAERYTAHDLSINLYRDYESTPIDTYNVADSLISTWPIEQTTRHPNVMRLESVRFTISDATPTGGAGVSTGRGFAFIGLGVEVEALDGRAWRLPATQKG